MALAVMLAGTASLSAQAPEEIIRKMDEQMERGTTEGIVFDLVMKLPIVGTITSHNMSLGDKMKIEVSEKDKHVMTWSDGKTDWVYDMKANTITIKNATSKENQATDDSDLNAFKGLAEGYDLTVNKETDEAWYITCKKKKSNKDKDDPKTVDLAIAKGTYYPIYIRTKKSVFTISFENVSVGVTEAQVTFNQADYPDATITDKR